MFDIFYSGPRPNLFPHELPALSLTEARIKSRTKFFWFIDGQYDYRQFDFTWFPHWSQVKQTHYHQFYSQFEQFQAVFATKDNSESVDNWHDRVFLQRNTYDEYWVVLKHEANWNVDLNWCPNPFEPPYIYVFGNTWYSSIEMPTVEYRVPGASNFKYIDNVVATTSRNDAHQVVLKHEATWNIDPNWCPNPFEPPYIYVFGNSWYTAEEMPTLEYRVPGATEYKYVNDVVATTSRNESWFTVLKHEANWQIDPNWCPNPFEPPYIYVFGNSWYTAEEMPTVEFRVPGATEYKYVNDVVATTSRNESWFTVLKHEATWNIDPNWCPNPFEPPYIYVFGNTWYSSIEMPTVEYRVPGATEYKYVNDVVATTSRNDEYWKLLDTTVDWRIDPNWCLNPFEPPYIYVFGCKWYSAEGNDGKPIIEYRVPGATEIKYVHESNATYIMDDTYWTPLVAGVKEKKLDWLADPFSPPYIYVFGNQWHAAQIMPTMEYRMPGATEIKYVDQEDAAATLLPNMKYWSVPEEIVQKNIDFSWLPDPGSPPYIYHFGTEFQMSVGLTYTVPGATEMKFEGDIPTVDVMAKAVKTVDMFFVDMNNKTSPRRFAAMQALYPDIQKIRFMNGWVETIKRCVGRSETSKFWVVSSENVYDDFNFEWHAEPWQNFMLHIFGSQWQKWSDTFLISKQEFTRHAKWAKELEQFPNLHFVKDQQVYRPDDVYDIYYVDHSNPGSQETLARIQKRYPDVKTARYVDNYLDTFKRIMSTVETDYVWIINSICDYSKFDFTWQPEPWQAKMLHVFPSNDQKFGDTFYVHVPSFKAQMDKISLLDWFDTVNYCADQNVPRLPMDLVVYDEDSVVDAIKTHTYTGPYTMFKHCSISATIPAFSPSIWRKKDRVVHVFTRSGNAIMVPREAKTMVDTQVYDYPYILPHLDDAVKDKPLDIVYISNGEPDAERWYNHLVEVVYGNPFNTKNVRIKRVQNVNGRAAAYKAAAEASSTPWFFAVFAKLEVNPDFDFEWQPDYMQEPKHYIFQAHNPVNGLTYGHMSVLAYNKTLTLATEEYGLDFTLSQKHEVVDMLSATAHFNQSPIITWRTAFRECIKLRGQTDDESASRLNTWLTVANGDHAEWSLRGATDAVKYYADVNGEHEKLMLSFEWQWLDEHFNSLYHL